MSPAEAKQLAIVQSEQRGLAIQNWDDLIRMADFLASSELIPMAIRKKPADVAIILMKGNEIGLKVMQAIDSIDVIQGKAALKPEAQLALIYQACPEAQIQIKTDTQKVAVTVSMARRKGEEPFVTTWDMNRARQMGLDKKDNYVKQPLVMLKWRAIGEGARTVFPDVTRGMYNTEEAEDFVEPSEKRKRIAHVVAENKPETKEVQSEVPSPEPENPAEPQRPQENRAVTPDPTAGDYVPTVSPLKGSALKTLDRQKLNEYLGKVRTGFESERRAPEGAWAEFIAKAEGWLATPATVQPGWTGDFEPGAGG